MKNLMMTSAAALLLASTAHAASILPTSYDMLNGNTGSYNYWDDTYDGSGDKTVDNAILTGGTGDLTDGVIATQNWNIVEPPLGPNGPYVGWLNQDPTITFRFDQAYDFNTITFYFDDSNGFGGVYSPSAVEANDGVSAAIADPAGSAPFAFVLDVSSLSATDTLEVDITRRFESSWIFLSEVEFDAAVAPVPLPAGGVLLLGGLAGFAALRRRKG